MCDLLLCCFGPFFGFGESNVEKHMRTAWSLGISACLSVMFFAAPALGGFAHIVGPSQIAVDGNPATVESATFEIVVDSVTARAVTGFEWQFGVTGSGATFDIPQSLSASQALITASSHTPPYFLLNNSGGLQAVTSDKGIRCGDLSASLAASDPTGKSLGQFVIDITDEASALGLHSIADPLSFTVLSNFGTEDLEITPFDFNVTPEPASIA